MTANGQSAELLPPRAVELLGGTGLVVLTTLNADGSPHSTPVWALCEGGQIVMSTVSKRKKARNLARDPRASVVVLDAANPACYFSVSGEAILTPDDDRRVLDRLAQMYLGAPYPAEDPKNVRLAVRLRPTHVIAQYQPAT